MNLANLMNLTNVEMALIIMEGSILFSLLIILFYLKRILAKASDKKYPLRDSNQWRESIQESEVICQNLSKNLQEKKEIGKRLVKQLDDKIQTLSSMMKKIDQKEGPPCEDTEKKDLKGQILEMAEAGCDISDIAQKLGLSRGEVQLALDLKRYSSLIESRSTLSH